MLPCFGFNNSIEIKIQKDSLNVGFDRFDKVIEEDICLSYPNKNTILTYSKAFQRVEKNREKKANGKNNGRPDMIEGFGGFKLKVDF